MNNLFSEHRLLNISLSTVNAKRKKVGASAVTPQNARSTAAAEVVQAQKSGLSKSVNPGAEALIKERDAVMGNAAAGNGSSLDTSTGVVSAVTKTAPIIKGINNPSAQGAAKRKAEREAKIANAKGFVTRTDEQGNTYQVEDVNATIIARQEAEKNAAQEEYAGAVKQDVNAKALDENKAPGGTIKEEVTEDIVATPPMKTGPSPSLTSYMAGLSPDQQTQLTNILGPENIAYFDSQFSALDPTAPTYQADTDGVLNSAKEFASTMFSGTKEMAKLFDEQNKTDQEDLDAEAEASRNRTMRDNESAQKKTDLAYDRLIRDQEIQNMEDEERWMTSSGVTGAWKSTRHSSNIINALQKGKTKLNDIKEDKIMSIQFYSEKAADAESTYLATVNKNAKEYKAAKLTLLDGIRKEANELTKTVFSTATDAIKAKEALKEKMIDQQTTLMKERADREWDGIKFFTQEMRMAKTELRQEQDTAMGQVMDGITKNFHRDPKWISNTNARLKTLGLDPIPSSIQTNEEAKLWADTQKDGYMNGLIGQYKDTQTGDDWGNWIANSVKDLPDGERRFSLATATEKALLKGDKDTVTNQLLSNAYLSFDVGQRNTADSGLSALSDLDYIDTLLNGADAGYGGVWKSLTENLKPLGELTRDESYVKMKAAIEQMEGTIRHARFGSALTASEAAAATDFLPDLKVDNAATIQWKLGELKGALLRSRAELYNSRLSPGAPRGQGAWERLTGNTDIGNRGEFDDYDTDVDPVQAGDSIWTSPTPTQQTNQGGFNMNSPGLSFLTKPPGSNGGQTAGSYDPETGSPSFTPDSPLGGYVKNNGFRVTQYYNGTFDQNNPELIAGKGTKQIFTDGRKDHASYNIAPPKPGMRNVPAPAFKGGSVVAVKKSNTGYGNEIRIRDAQGNTWIYGHLDKINVKEGDQVADGVPVGTMGDTGWATGVTLHLEARDKNNKPFDFAI